ncbi:pH-sensitive chloride channel 2-like [Homalodisca vitripennis]|uniref:pH-sensitive chloride channel 2-like n=1 Tax=Homalodisca vitripennis TaxID=197043 RepID=UPI001EEA0A4C|nr:pH-sensitive chloride channel 2-like [Homalodisca vitripennis]
MKAVQIFWIVVCHLASIATVALSDTCTAPLNLTGSDTERIMQITDPCRYDKWTRPNLQGKTKVFTRIYVYFLGSIEAQNLQFTTQILLRYRWRDERLSNATAEVMEGENMLMGRIWTPHLYLVNEQESKVMGSGRQDVLVSIQPDGTVLHSTRMKVTLLCLMNLQKFPFDNQRCPLVLESWAYNTSQLELGWEADSPVKVNKKLQLTEYSLRQVYVNTSDAQYSIDEKDSSENLNYYGKFAGNYSTLTVSFELERQVGHYIMDYYVPSILLVVVSWVTFWLDANAVPGRTTLGTSTMLTFITLSRNIGSSLPKVSYIKATEIWFIVCTGFIFGSLVEFAFVNIIWRRKKNVELKKVSSKYILKSTLTPQLNRRNNNSSLGEKCKSMSSLDSQFDTTLNSRDHSQLTVMSLDSIRSEPLPNSGRKDSPNNLTVPTIQFEEPHPPPQPKSFFTMTPQEIAHWIDRRSRIVFPLAFVIFNCFYWVFVWF